MLIDGIDDATVRVLCTQPRRIAAVSLAQRVANERAEVIGNSCGYIIRNDRCEARSPKSITFATTQVVLRILENDPHLNSFSVIIIGKYVDLKKYV